MPAIEPTALPPAVPDAIEAYVRRNLDFFPPGFLQGRRIGLYQHSSVSRDVLPRILQGLGAEVVTLGRTDEFVPIDTEAVAEADIRRGREWAGEHRLAALVSTDGDGDRPLVGDERGEGLRGAIVCRAAGRGVGEGCVRRC